MVLQRDVDPRVALALPALYGQGRLGRGFSAARLRGEAPPRKGPCVLRDFSLCAIVFYEILVILHTCIFRDARAMRERERKIERKNAKIAKNMRKIAKIT